MHFASILGIWTLVFKMGRKVPTAMNLRSLGNWKIELGRVPVISLLLKSRNETICMRAIFELMLPLTL